MLPSPEATYERARRFAKYAMWTILLQCRRIKTEEPEDSEFPLRKRIDFEFLIYSLIRFRKAAVLAASILGNNAMLEKALKDFDSELPDITKMRNVLEHFEEYAIDRGNNKQISRKELEVSYFGPTSFEWLGEKLDTEKVLHSCQKLYGAIKASHKIKKDVCAYGRLAGEAAVPPTGGREGEG